MNDYEVKEEILEKNNYAPSAIARGMVSKSMKTVSVLTVDIRVPHYARTAYTIEREFSRRGYEVSLCNTGGELEETIKYLRTAREKKLSLIHIYRNSDSDVHAGNKNGV